MATLVVPVMARVRPSARPARPKLVASVTTKDGTLVRVTSNPLRKPVAEAERQRDDDPSDDRRSPVAGDDREVIELAASTEPTERSSSPAIMSRPTGMAMMPARRRR